VCVCVCVCGIMGMCHLKIEKVNTLVFICVNTRKFVSEMRRE
jgi:hypothetical protein